MAVPVLPLPELQWTIMTFSGSAISKVVNVRLHLTLYLCKVLTFEPSVAFLGDLIKEGEWWSMVIRPMIVRDAAAKVLVCVVSGTLRRVNDVVFVAMLLVQELCDL